LSRPRLEYLAKKGIKGLWVCFSGGEWACWSGFHMLHASNKSVTPVVVAHVDVATVVVSVPLNE